MKIDLGARAVAGLARKECEDCGIKFTPKKPYHNLCDECVAKKYDAEDD